MLLSLFFASAAGQSAPANSENQPRTALTQSDYDRLRVQASHLTDREVNALKIQAGAGDTRSQLLLGMAYQLGAGGLLRDQKEAQQWFRRAADHHAAQEGSSIAATGAGETTSQVLARLGFTTSAAPSDQPSSASARVASSRESALPCQPS